MARIQDLIKQDTAIEMRKNTFQRGAIYRVSVPFKTELPLGLFYCDLKIHKSKEIVNYITCEDCDKECNGLFNDCEGIVRNFKSKNINSISGAGNHSIQINTIQKIKVRPFLIISSNVDIYELKTDFIYGIPIFSLKEKQLSNKKFMDKLLKNKIPYYYYLDKAIQGVSKPSILDLKSIIPIHKDLLIQFKGYLGAKDMIIVSEKINTLLDLNQHENTQNLETLEETKQILETKLEIICKSIEILKKCEKNA